MRVVWRDTKEEVMAEGRDGGEGEWGEDSRFASE